MIYCWNIKKTSPIKWFTPFQSLAVERAKPNRFIGSFRFRCVFFSLKITKIFLKSSPQKKLMKETEKKSKKMAADDVTWRAPLPRDWCRRADPISSSSCIQIFISMTAASRTASDRRHLKWIIWINFHWKKKSLSLIKPAMLLLSFFFEI